MAKLSQIRDANTAFASKNSENTGLVCVFAGATSGIGAATLEKTVTILQESTIYVIGRSESRFEAQRAKLEDLNSSCTIVFLETEFSLIAGVDVVAKQLLERKTKVDYLFMSTQQLPLAGATCMYLSLSSGSLLDLRCGSLLMLT